MQYFRLILIARVDKFLSFPTFAIFKFRKFVRLGWCLVAVGDLLTGDLLHSTGFIAQPIL